MTRRLDPWFIAALVLLGALTAYTRFTAPSRMAVTNDEMLHLESYRNHYRTDDIYPLFLHKLERSGLLEGERLEQFRELYHGSTLFQRGLCVIVDLHPPAFPVMAEIIEAATHSSLTTLRYASVIASILGVLFMFKLGEALRDRTLGLWLAAFMAMAFLTQTYAGIARPYPLAQCAVALALWVFVRGRTAEHASPWRFWLAALFAQCTNWLVWAIMGPLVIIELVTRLRSGCGFGRLFKQTWWYALLSASLLPLLAIQMMNPATAHNTGGRWLAVLWYHFYLASPFANIDSLMELEILAVFSPAGIILLLLGLAGIASVVADVDFAKAVSAKTGPSAGLALTPVRIALVVCLVTSCLTAAVGASGTRLALIYILMPTVFAGIGAQWALRTSRVSHVTLTLLLAAFIVLRIGWPEDPYRRAFWSQTDYPAVAERIESELEENDQWVAFPRQLADCLYRYADLPEPVLVIDESDMRQLISRMPPPGGAMLVFTRVETVEGSGILRRAPERWEFPNGLTVVKVPAR